VRYRTEFVPASAYLFDMERYGVAKEDADKQLAEWERSASDAWFTKQ
jgi:hypothetical protein